MTPEDRKKIKRIAKRAADKIVAVLSSRADQTGQSIGEAAEEVFGKEKYKPISAEDKKLADELDAYIEKILAEPWPAKKAGSN